MPFMSNALDSGRRTTPNTAATSVTPTAVDFWCAGHVASVVGRHPLVDLAVPSAINHNRGSRFALISLILRLRASERGADADPEMQRQLAVDIIASMVAVLSTFGAAAAIAWLPPNRMPGLGDRYLNYLTANVRIRANPPRCTWLS